LQLKVEFNHFDVTSADDIRLGTMQYARFTAYPQVL
jgi:hypothetical protein